MRIKFTVTARSSSLPNRPAEYKQNYLLLLDVLLLLNHKTVIQHALVLALHLLRWVRSVHSRKLGSIGCICNLKVVLNRWQKNGQLMTMAGPVFIIRDREDFLLLILWIWNLSLVEFWVSLIDEWSWVELDLPFQKFPIEVIFLWVLGTARIAGVERFVGLLQLSLSTWIHFLVHLLWVWFAGYLVELGLKFSLDISILWRVLAFENTLIAAIVDDIGSEVELTIDLVNPRLQHHWEHILLYDLFVTYLLQFWDPTLKHLLIGCFILHALWFWVVFLVYGFFHRDCCQRAQLNCHIIT